MLQQILTRTPLYVWAILAGLIYRGYLASKDREVVFWKLFILPAIMPLLTVPDLTLKFGHAGQSVAIWAGAAALVTLLTWQFSSARVSPAAQAGNVLVRGTWLPLVAMLGIFFTKYAVNIMLAVNPQARGDVLFAAGCCALFGLFNGIFFGWAARDATSYLQAPAAAVS